ncbi:CPBP family intramembrane glutamic endopeptidase [Acetivibrio straminisolvens]|uniref:CPBP family intramembrane glutamic endopeptidase n=1 Tax=Acetivibrio straminisolvens TaxID=253314 RepID=UPI00224033EB|nr:type II CAAX endopeptidase family protein [Acetivibrio straminisolvens]
MKKSLIYPLVIYFMILVFWILAWLLKTNLLDNVQFFVSSFGSFLYWTLSKIIIWILPCILFFKHKNIKVSDIIITKDKSWLKWGGLIGILIAVLNIIFNVISKQRIWNVELSFAFLNAAIMAPLLEEFLFRGFILNMLQKELPFYIANIITSACFLIMHIPGWFFMGVISANFYNLTFISIFILSLIFGYAFKKGNSIKSSIIAHILNNIT